MQNIIIIALALAIPITGVFMFKLGSGIGYARALIVVRRIISAPQEAPSKGKGK